MTDIKLEGHAYINIYPDATAHVSADRDPGAICAAIGIPSRLRSILMTSSTEQEDGSYIIDLMLKSDEMTDRYILSQVWIAQQAKVYNGDRTVKFYVNQAANPVIRRVAARLIGEVLN